MTDIPQKETWCVSRGEGRYHVEARALRIGEDLGVAIYGGTRPHIGAVAIAIPRPSLKDSSITSATSSVFTVIGHKDDIIAKREAERLASQLKQIVVVLAGVHIDDATDTEIEILIKESSECTDSLLEQLLPHCVRKEI